MAISEWFRKGYSFFLCALVFFLPLPFITTAIAVAAIACCWLPATKVKDIPTLLLRNKPLLLWIVYFLLHAISYTYSSNKEQSAFDVQRKLSFLLLPLAIGAGPKITDVLVRRIFLSFIAGITFISFICLGCALYQWAVTGKTTQFFYHSLAGIVSFSSVNAVYMAWYVLFSLSALLLYPWHFNQRWQRVAHIIAILVELIFYILLSSRLLLVLLVVLLVPVWFHMLAQTKAISRRSILIGGASVLLLVSAIFFTPNPIRQRFVDVIHPAKQSTNTLDGKKKVLHFTNATLRVFLWRMAIDNMQQHNFWAYGCGNGDVEIYQTDQVHQWEARGYDFSYNETVGSYNLHNMYLQTLLMLGLPGLIVFCLIVFLPFFYLKKTNYPQLFLLFHVTAALFFLQEAAFQTQAGVIFYTFFSILFWRVVKGNQNGQPLATQSPIY